MGCGNSEDICYLKLWKLLLVECSVTALLNLERQCVEQFPRYLMMVLKFTFKFDAVDDVDGVGDNCYDDDIDGDQINPAAMMRFIQAILSASDVQGNKDHRSNPR